MSTKNKISIKKWALEDRPREKLLAKGIHALSSAELLAIIIGSGSKEESAVDVARKILINANNNINNLGKYSVKDLKKIKGIGEAKAISIMAALELGKRRKQEEVIDKQKIISSKDIFDYFHPLLADLPHEEFWMLLLNRANKIIDKIKISQGGISGTIIDTKLIIRWALDKLATGIIICHNHPSGNLQPSEHDIKITLKLKKAAAYMDIKLLDHIIVADGGYYSFADANTI